MAYEEHYQHCKLSFSSSAKVRQSWFSHFCSNLLFCLRGCHQAAILHFHSLISLSFQGPCDWIIFCTPRLTITTVTDDSPPLSITVNNCLRTRSPAPREDKYPYQTDETQSAATTLLMIASARKNTSLSSARSRRVRASCWRRDLEFAWRARADELARSWWSQTGDWCVNLWRTVTFRYFSRQDK